MAYAANLGELEIVKEILKQGISQEGKDWGLRDAAKKGHLEVVAALKNAGAKMPK